MASLPFKILKWQLILKSALCAPQCSGRTRGGEQDSSTLKRTEIGLKFSIQKSMSGLMVPKTITRGWGTRGGGCISSAQNTLGAYRVICLISVALGGMYAGMAAF